MKQQLKSMHFWMVLAAGLVGIAIHSGLIPATGNVHYLVETVAGLLAAAGYQIAYRDTPPPGGAA